VGVGIGAWTGYATRVRTVPRKVSRTLARRGVPDGYYLLGVTFIVEGAGCRQTSRLVGVVEGG
jgi:hypothetical protein